MNNQNEASAVFSDLKVLDSKVRLSILNFLNENRREYSFSEISVQLSNIDKGLLQLHLGILYISNMIKNHGFDTEAKYSITPKGADLLQKLKSDETAESIISEVIA